MIGFSLYLLLLVLQLSIGHELTDINTPNLQDTILELRDKLRDLEIMISQQNTNIAQQNTQIAEQNTKFAVQDTKIADQNTKFVVQDTKIADQNTIIIAEFNTKLIVQDTKIADVEREISVDQLKQSTTNNGSTTTGSIFTRWGRRDCPSDVSQLVYSGITGGSHYTHTGGAAEYVCLPPDPTWTRNKLFNGSYWGYMYGTEYQEIPQTILDYKVPCAVCRSKYSIALMIPGRGECYLGWTTAYSGELVSGYHGHKAATQYVCLDGDPQINGTKTDNNGKLMFPVRAQCGSLPCPPYENNALMTCVVCLK